MLTEKTIELSKEEYWAMIFIEARILECGINFEQFLTAPRYYLSQCGQESAPICIEQGFRPLLPRQAAIAKKLKAQGF